MGATRPKRALVSTGYCNMLDYQFMGRYQAAICTGLKDKGSIQKKSSDEGLLNQFLTVVHVLRFACSNLIHVSTAMLSYMNVIQNT